MKREAKFDGLLGVVTDTERESIQLHCIGEISVYPHGCRCRQQSFPATFWAPNTPVLTGKVQKKLKICCMHSLQVD